MMRKALVASIGMAAMLALAACSGDDKVSQSRYDAVEAELAPERAALAKAQADLKAARDDLEAADDDYQSAKAAAEAAQRAADEAERAFEGGELGLVQLERARGAAVDAQTAAEDAKDAADAARAAADAGSAALQKLVDLMEETGPLPTGAAGVGADTYRIAPGRSMVVGNVSFACDADSPGDCVVVVDDQGRFTRNTVLVTASLNLGPALARRLISGTTDTSDAEADNRVHFHPADENTASTDKVSAYIREVGVDTVYEVTVSLASAAVKAGTYAGTEDDRPDGHEGNTGAADFKVEAAPSASSGWTVASLDGLPDVVTATEFEGSMLPEAEGWTKAWTVDDATLPGGRQISLDVRTNAKPTTTTTDVDKAFSNARDRTAVKGALTAAGFQLLTNSAYNAGPAGGGDDRLPRRYGAQLEIMAATNERLAGVDEDDDEVDESQRIRFGLQSAPAGIGFLNANNTPSRRYALSALEDGAEGTPAWFYGMPGRVVCGGDPVDCGDDVQVVIDSPHGTMDPDDPGGANSGAIWWTNASSDGVRFKAAGGEHEFYVPDADWVSIGVWSVQPETGATVADVQMGAFVHGSDPFDYADTLEGEAEYVGDAIGRYAKKDGNAPAEAGKFTATANFAFDFGAADADGDVSGSITDFRLDGADDAENWTFTLTERSIEGLVETDGSTAGTGGPAGVLGGSADGSVMAGQLNMRMFGPNTEAATEPTAVAGTFFANGSRSGRELSLIGAYAAGPKPADE